MNRQDAPFSFQSSWRDALGQIIWRAWSVSTWTSKVRAGYAKAVSGPVLAGGSVTMTFMFWAHHVYISLSLSEFSFRLSSIRAVREL
jgi:hypothetical protein